MTPGGTSIDADRRSDLGAMRALAHPIRVRMVVLLRGEALSASDLARRLGIRFGSARFHLHQLVDADIARPAGERIERGGRALLFRVPERLRIDIGPHAPPEVNVAIHRGIAAELERRLDAAALDQRPDDTIHDAIVLREISLSDRKRTEAGAIIEDALTRLLRLHDPSADDAQPHTIGLFSFRTPDRPAPAGTP
jgi:DNA-binding transcriptional ArsR family regulator